MRFATCTAPLLALLLFLPTPWGRDVLAADDAPATETVQRAPLGGTIDVKGTLVPAKHEEVAPDPQSWRGKLEVIEAAQEGPVVKGQTLMRFVDEDYRRELTERERKLELARMDLDQKERSFALRKNGWIQGRGGWSRQLEAAERTKQRADEALERFDTVERKLKEQEANYALEGRRISIQNMREELDQLEKMYKEDDLTEETEEIVLKRNRRNLERMLESFERYKNRWEYARTIDLPREHERLAEAAERAATDIAWLQATLPQDLRRAELDLQTTREGLARAEAELEKLRKDEAVFTLAAPIEGYAVRGQLGDGAWKGLDRDEAYEPGATVGAKQVVFTVVDESVMRIRTSVKEADLPDVEVGQPVSFHTSLTGHDDLEGSVGKVARYGSGGTYDVILRVTKKDERLRTGLAADVKIVRAKGEAVLSVPTKCLESGKDGSYVWVVTEGQAPARTKVEIARRVGGRTEIVSGLEAGQRVLAEPPAKKDE